MKLSFLLNSPSRDLPRRHTVGARVAIFALGLAPALSLSACNKEDAVTNKPVAATERPRRASIAFVRCVESNGGGCVESSSQLGAWDAFSVLGWLAAGSPISILSRLPNELQHHSDRKLVQRRFTAAAGRLQSPLRGAECEAKNVIDLDPMVGDLEKAAGTRLQNIGIWNQDIEAVIKGLAEESRGLKGGYLVEMGCMNEPYSFYVATAVDGERQVAVGMLSGLPEFLGGHAPSREVVERTLSSTTLGNAIGGSDSNLVHPWIPVAPEGF